MSFYCDKELFCMYKQRNIDYKKNNYPNCDKLMIPLIYYINQMNGVTTVFCCESHPEYEDYMFQTMTVVSGIIGYKKLHKLYNSIYRMDSDFCFKIGWILQTSYHQINANSDWVPIHQLYADGIDSIETKEYLFKLLYKEIGYEKK